MKSLRHTWFLFFIWFAALPLHAGILAVQPTHAQLTNLPTLYIETFDGQDVVSKEVSKYARLYYVVDGSETFYDSLLIRGRGNGTWVWAKKPYRIKFQNKEKFLGTGHANAKKWTLMSNYADKSMLRNALTYQVGLLVGLPFTAGSRFVDLYLNGKYLGTYQISDQIEIRKHRVDIHQQEESVTTDSTNITGGYLLEVDGYTNTDAPYFYTDHGVHIRIHDPDYDLINYRQKNYIKAYVQKFETALFSDNFKNSTYGYRAYVDTTTLIDWYLATEITANMDSYWSTFFYKDRDDPHLYFGPLWDFDIAYNNCRRIGDVTEHLMADVGFGAMLAKEWLDQMWNDPWFSRAVNRRYREIYQTGLDSVMVHCVDSLAKVIYRSQEENYKLWSINTRVHDEITLYNTYDEYIAELRAFIPLHNAFLLKALATKKPIEPSPAFVNKEGQSYRFFCKGYPTGVVDVVGQKVQSGAVVGMYEASNDRLSQQWYFEPSGVYYRIFNCQSHLALCDPSPSTSVSYQLTTVTPAASDLSQLWTVVARTQGYYNLKNVKTGHTMNNSQSKAVNDNPVLGYFSSDEDKTSANRLWTVTPITGDPSSIRSVEDMDYRLLYSPSAHTIRFISPSPESLTFEATVYDVSGRAIDNFKANETYDASSLPQGTYIVTWYYAGKQHSAKLMKK